MTEAAKRRRRRHWLLICIVGLAYWLFISLPSQRLHVHQAIHRGGTGSKEMDWEEVVSVDAINAENGAAVDEKIGVDESIAENIVERVSVRPKRCASVEEMGNAGRPSSSSKQANLRLRSRIRQYIADHGAQHVRNLPASLFCKRGFVFGRSHEDGFGNEMYKILTAAGVALMLNRSLIIGEDSSTNPAYLGLSGVVHQPFGEYISYSSETFTMREIKHLWVIHDCAGKYKRPLNLRIDSLQRSSTTNSLCEDWTKWATPIIWFSGAQDAVALQLFLKNLHPTMRSLAAKHLGNPADESSRTNIFGELMNMLISPMPVIQEAVEWTLKDGLDPDVSLHLRMRNSKSKPAIDAACSCVIRTLKQAPLRGKRLPRVVVVTDTPAVLSTIFKSLEGSAEVIYFDYEHYISTANMTGIIKRDHFQPPRKRIRDWGPLPRWAALVDFFLASRAKYGVVSGGGKRVATTYAQLVASLAAASNLDSDGNFSFYSSFQPSLLVRGLALQNGWGHAWRTFSGSLSCRNQAQQCALTTLLPHAWWDNPVQSPSFKDIRTMRSFGIHLNQTGHISWDELNKFCRSRGMPKPMLVKLQLPPFDKLKLPKSQVSRAQSDEAHLILRNL